MTTVEGGRGVVSVGCVVCDNSGVRGGGGVGRVYSVASFSWGVKMSPPE